MPFNAASEERAADTSMVTSKGIVATLGDTHRVYYNRHLTGFLPKDYLVQSGAGDGLRRENQKVMPGMFTYLSECFGGWLIARSRGT